MRANQIPAVDVADTAVLGQLSHAMLAWVNLLAPEGYVNAFLVWTGLTANPPDWLNGNPYSVILALTYGYSLLAATCGARSYQTRACSRRRVTWAPVHCEPSFMSRYPCRRRGYLVRASSCSCRCLAIITRPTLFLDRRKPACSATRSTSTSMAVRSRRSVPPLTLILSLFLGILMAYYTYTIAKASREVRA